MSFTIITVALNAADLLPATLESVLQQDFADVETIVVDGTSWDRTPEVLARYAGEIDKVATTFDAGIFYAMNEAAQMASNEYVLFMNAGDRFHARSTLSTIWARRVGDPDILYGDHLYVDGGRHTLARSADYAALRETLRRGDVCEAWLAKIPGHQATFTRASLLEAHGYDTAYEICADHAFLLTAYDRGARMQYIDEIVSLYAGGGMSIRRHARCRMEFCALYRRHSQDPDAIDDHFYPGGGAPPFPSTSPMNGAIVDGVLARPPRPPRPPHANGAPAAEPPLAWCAGEGFRLATPSGGRAHTLVLEGHNDLADQSLELRVAGKVVAMQGVPRGPFALTLTLAQPLAPGTVVDCLPRHGEVRSVAVPPGEGGGAAAGASAEAGSPAETVPAERYVSLALRRFRFETLAKREPPLLGPGETHFSSRSAASAKLLAHGWAGLEETHVWSLSERADIVFRAEGPAEALVLMVRENPFLDETQTLTIELNGAVVASAPLVRRGEVRVPVADVWRSGDVNELVLAVSALAQPPGDPRMLGLGLERLVVVAPAGAGEEARAGLAAATTTESAA
ncbi:glycosyltransferase family 2 protein [Acuticoccus sp. I52.16.1]|uniref:glycosyltransferase family 2 protein n=1 Tax=Acuticoccus sp. I52.16.1 TaxID=2928472 RepID=UPI001FD14F11|nr:glycosyltransferase family 2 protein [Acuticoccus sp. I52.16.1]UOM37291.1 glycosyltransferase [Acuticoccus sp. I52.16.1]